MEEVCYKQQSYLQFIIELTNYCNFSCKYCYLDQAEALDRHERHSMSKETGGQIVDFLCGLHERFGGVIALDFLDGEPLLNFPVMKYMVEKCREYEKAEGRDIFICRFTTNGSLLTTEIIDFTIENNIYFNISLDGIAESHNKNRIFNGGGNTFDIVWNNALKVKELMNFGIVSTFGINNYMYMKDSVTFLIESGFHNIELNIAMFRGEESKSVEAIIEPYRECLQVFLNLYSKHNFESSYIILDRILEQLFSEDGLKRNCCKPFKINYLGAIFSCDRIHTDKNKRICSVKNKIITSDVLMSHHQCEEMNDRCCSCSYRSSCMPCSYYLEQIDTEESDVIPMFCLVMQALIDEAKAFYKKFKGDPVLQVIFNRKFLAETKRGAESIIDIRAIEV